jgi:Zn-dependent peptidase ImmA (M78 family)
MTNAAVDGDAEPERSTRPPGLLRLPDPEVVAKARAFSAEFPFRRPHEIDVRAMAAARRIFHEIAPLVRGQARLVKNGGIALATIDARTAEEDSYEFALAHEIGHDVVDPDFSDWEACVLARGKGGRRVAESRANDFAAETTMPENMLVPFLARLGGEPGTTLEHVFEAADAFRMPDDAMAVRTLLYTKLACAAVYSIGGRVKWWVRNERFATAIYFGARIPDKSLASRLHRGLAVPRAGQSMASGLWARTSETRELREEVVLLKKKDAVLTWLVEKE